MTSSALIRESVGLLRRHAPFDQMPDSELDALVQASELVYFAPGALLIQPEEGIPGWCWIVREGALLQHAADGSVTSGWGAGEALPVGALLAGRAVSAPIRAQGDVFCWRLPAAFFHELIARSEPFRRFCQDRLASLNRISQEALRIEVSRRVAQERLLERPVIELVRRAPVQVTPHATLRDVFLRMETEQVGSVIIGAGQGIFTRQDVIGRVVLAGVALESPISEVMSHPLVTLDPRAPVAEAVLTMAAHGIRHLALVDEDGVHGVVTERDLFALQRQGISHLSGSILRAESVPELARCAQGIREWSSTLVAQGTRPGFVTALISRLNDQLTRRLLSLRAAAHALPVDRVCWLALGSEGREEQTISTDQDNALILPLGGAEHARDRWLDFARAVNEDLDACGYPLCKGQVMASNPAWCLELTQWQERFEQWIRQGSPQALLNVNIFFDFRGLAGDLHLAHVLQTEVYRLAQDTPRFLKQMSDNALRNGPPAGWAASTLGSWMPGAQDEVLDLKLHGTMPLVDGVRLLALAAGIQATGTAARLQGLAQAGRITPEERAAWGDAFELFQTLRLRSQDPQRLPATGMPPNCLRMSELSAIEQRALRESWRQMRKLQQRLALDFPG